MNKGYSLVELAIILLVVSFIIFLTVRGKELIDTASYSKEAAYIQNLRSFAESACYYDSTCSDFYDITKNPYPLTSPIRNMCFMLTPLKISLNSPNPVGFYPATHPDTYGPYEPRTTMGLYALNDPQRTASPCQYYIRFTSVASYHIAIDSYYLCKLEQIIDDGNPVTGKVRYMVYDANQPLSYNDNCKEFYNAIPDVNQDFAIDISN